MAKHRNKLIIRLNKETMQFLADQISEEWKNYKSPYAPKSIRDYVVHVGDFIVYTARKAKVNFCIMGKEIQLFNGKCWSPVDEEDFGLLITHAANALNVPPGIGRYHDFIRDCESQLKSSFLQWPKPEEANPNSYHIIPFQNGVLEIDKNTPQFREFRASDFNTFLLPYEYSPDANCPQWDSFLDRVLPDKETQKTFYQLFGSVLIRHIKLEKAGVLYGTGGNGKSVVFDVICQLFGLENISYVTLKDLSTEIGRMQIVNKLLNYSSELSEKNADMEEFKKLVSREPIMVRNYYQMAYSTSNYSVFIFNSNDLPFITSNSKAIERRLVIIPFKQTITEAEMDKTLSNKIIAEELPGIMNRVIAGMRNVIETEQIYLSKEVLQQMRDWVIESNSVTAFIHDMKYVVCSDHSIGYNELYSDYLTYCNENQYKPYNKKNFGKKLESMGIKKTRSNASFIFWVKKSL